jgi:hypothetical protein
MKKILVVLSFCVFLTQAAYAAPAVDWNKETTQHFEIYFKDTPISFIEEVKEAAENHYDKIVDVLGFRKIATWSHEKVQIYIFSDQDDFVQSFANKDWAAGIANYSRRSIHTFPAAHGFFDSTLPHELGHILFREFIGQESRVPLWVDEGVAMYQEQAKRFGMHRRVKDALAAKTFIPLNELGLIRLTSQDSQARIDLYYSEAASVMNYLIVDFGDYKFLSLCRKLRDGFTFEEALRVVYRRFNNMEELNRAWVKFLEGQDK